VRWSQTLIPTQKESPADAVAPSHILLLRAGMIRPLGAGAYTYMPLGLRVLQRAARIVREEMDAAGAVELHMPALQPIEIWQESGRDRTMRGILMEFKLNERSHVTLGPTHEEVITDLARDLLKSYKQLPITLYQIQTKFRNEPRPRFGILRTREFLMKDAYSFDADAEQLGRSYDAMYEAYCRIFDRCGLPYVAVEAESGPIGGDASHEFMVPCASGEDHILTCAASGYAANVEKAEVGAISWPAPADASAPAYRSVPTPGQRTIDEVAAFLKVAPEATVKTLVYLADGKAVAVLVRGDHEANEAKVRRAFGAGALEPADPRAIEEATGAPMGFLGPVGLKIPTLVDQSVAAMARAVVGGNAVDTHLVDVVPGRDFALDRVGDYRNAVPGDPCPRSGRPMELTTGIEIGHVFKLGTKYSRAMGANYLDDKGQEHPIIMGCYGIGINRILASAVEACHDKDGIRWPLPLAPYDVLVAPLLPTNPDVAAAADRIAGELERQGVEVLIDDRDQRPGVKFKDADLIGIPLRVVVGERGLKEGTIELKWRDGGAARTVPVESAAQVILEEMAARREAMAEMCAGRAAARAEAKAAARGGSK
jgi:prolyl-tRNA synthetase